MATEDAVPDELVLIEGSQMILEGNESFHTGHIPYAAIRRLGNEIYVRTDENISSFPLRFIDRRKKDRRRPNSDRRHYDQ